MTWESIFRKRIKSFRLQNKGKEGYIPISVKIRVSSGCFHRTHSPHAYQIIDKYMQLHPEDDYQFEEHESGPEFLVWASLVTAGISLSANIINLITAVIKSRNEGIKLGDHPDAPLELIFRYFDEKGNLREERVLKIDSTESISESVIEKAISQSVYQLSTYKNSKKEE